MPARFPLILLLWTVLAAGCDANKENDRVGVTWRLDAVEVGSGAPVPFAADTLLFESETEVSIQSCNDCTGTYRTASNVLTFDGLVCTERACIDQFDLGSRLAASPRVLFSLSDNGLLLIAEEEGGLSTFSFLTEGEPGN